MPTGYTSDLYEGKEQSFPEFVLSCAHAFGALVTLRDGPRDAPIPTFTANTDYYDAQIAKGNARLVEAEAWTDEEADAHAAQAHERAMREWNESAERRTAIVERYTAMLAEVQAWEPPTEDHVGLKTFMVEQLTDSIKFDGGNYPKPNRLHGSEFQEQEIERARRDIDYGTQHCAEEIERVATRNAWVDALRVSLAASV